MGFVKSNPALTRAQPDPWLALLAAGFHGEYLADAGEHRSWRRAAREVGDTAGDTWPRLTPTQAGLFGTGVRGQGRMQ